MLPDLLAATKYRVLVSAVYGAGESMAVTATGRTGEWACNPGPQAAPNIQNCGATPRGPSRRRWALSLPAVGLRYHRAEGNRVFV